MADWSKDISEIETPILIKYVKTEVKNKWSVQFGENKKISKKEEPVFYCSHFQRKKCTHAISHYSKIKGVARILQHICVTFGEKIITHLFIQNVLKIVRFKVID